MKRKAQQINVTTIIILVLAILVLLIVAISYTGGWTKLWQRITGTYKAHGGLEISAAAQQCNVYWSVKSKQFCEERIPIAGDGNMTCIEIGNSVGWKEQGGLMETTSKEAREFCS